MPASISSTVPKRMIFLSRSGWNVSTWTLMRPQAGRGERARPGAAGGSRWWSWPRPRTPGTRGDAAHDLDDVRPQRRLAAGEAELAEARRCTAARATVSISSAVSSSGEGTKRQPAQRHAVHAPQVAVVDDRDAQVVDLAAEAVFGRQPALTRWASRRLRPFDRRRALTRSTRRPDARARAAVRVAARGGRARRASSWTCRRARPRRRPGSALVARPSGAGRAPSRA